MFMVRSNFSLLYFLAQTAGWRERHDACKGTLSLGSEAHCIHQRVKFEDNISSIRFEMTEALWHRLISFSFIYYLVWDSGRYKCHWVMCIILLLVWYFMLWVNMRCLDDLMRLTCWLVWNKAVVSCSCNTFSQPAWHMWTFY